MLRHFIAVSVAAAFLAIASSGCSVSPPSNPNNLCSIFQEKDSWYSAAHKVHDKYGIPIHVAMAIMHQESGFVEDAKPPMRWFLFIPYGRGSSAYGCDDFADALDFIAWYMTKTKAVNGISLSDAYNQYLNYHEGWSGFKNGSYRSKDWLLKTARGVQQRADSYKQQLLHCDLY